MCPGSRLPCHPVRHRSGGSGPGHLSPYDVIDDDLRARLADRHPNNVVRIDLPADENGEDRYAVAARLLHDWQSDGVLAQDDEPSLYVHSMGYRDEEGRPRQTTGVLGALELRPPGDGILPHEKTTPKAKSDRLEMLPPAGRTCPRSGGCRRPPGSPSCAGPRNRPSPRGPTTTTSITASGGWRGRA